MAAPQDTQTSEVGRGSSRRSPDRAAITPAPGLGGTGEGGSGVRQSSTSEPSTPRLGSSRCQCPTCDLYFSATSTFDAHRIWTCSHVRHRKDECWDSRRCLTAAELPSVGLVYREPGVWGSASPEQAIWSRRSAPESTEGASA